MSYVVVEQGYQVTIPALLRSQIPVELGSIMEMAIDGGRYTLSPVTENPNTEMSFFNKEKMKTGKNMEKVRRLAKRFRELAPDTMTSTDVSDIYDEYGLPK